MLLLGLVCLLLGTSAVLTAVFASEGTGELLGIEMSAMALFLVGLVSGVLLLWGATMTRLGARRELRVRREHRELERLKKNGGNPAAPRHAAEAPVSSSVETAPTPSPDSGSDARPGDRDRG